MGSAVGNHLAADHRDVVPADWGNDGGACRPELRLEALIDLGFHGDSPGFQAEGLAYDPTAGRSRASRR